MKLKFRGTAAELRYSLKLLPHVLAGRHPDALGLHPVFWGYCGNAVLRLIQSAFKEKMHGRTGSDGIKWAKLAAATLAKREREGVEHDDILRETGALLASLEPGERDQPSGAEWQIFRFVPNGVVVGTCEEKADRHQRGTEYMPRRPIVKDDDVIPLAWEPALERAMERGLKKCIEMICDAGGVA